MKHDVLRSIAHNIADSLASGIGLMIGAYEMDIFGEAAKSPGGFVTVDFLKGTTEGGSLSTSLALAIAKYRDALPEFCEKQHSSFNDFRVLTAKFSSENLGPRVVVTVEDRLGRRSVDEYTDIPLTHVKTLDSLGRIRTKRK